MSGTRRPRLGLLLVTSGWFREVGLQVEGSDTTREVARIGADLARRLGEHTDVTYDGVVFTADEARRTARRILEAEVDGVLLAPLMWCEDQVPRAALEHLGELPLILWTFSGEASLPPFVPFQLMLRGSGPVAAMQLSGCLKREGRPYHAVSGHAADPRVLAEIRTLARALAVSRSLRGARIGVLPFRCDQMSATWVDELGLRARYGVELRYLELERLRRLAAAAEPEEITRLRGEVEATGARVEVDGACYERGLRFALALAAVAREERIDALAMNDVIPEMHACFGLRPSLCNPTLSATGFVVSMEADVGAATAMLALRRFTGHSPFYTEPFSIDHESNTLLMGHAGYHDTSNADVTVPSRIVRDVEYENTDPVPGAANLFKYRAGPVTAVCSIWEGTRLRWCVVQGVSLPGPAKMDGNSHLVFQPELPVDTFTRRAVEIGVSQHWLFLPGHLAQEIATLCRSLDVEHAPIRA